ncbi:hypothetical protein AAVH_07855 [Aphelenchoides avenae]|nr:hypothetical protein AAVH_07855 [Aphelenchus avenae]
MAVPSFVLPKRTLDENFDMRLTGFRMSLTLPIDGNLYHSMELTWDHDNATKTIPLRPSKKTSLPASSLAMGPVKRTSSQRKSVTSDKSMPASEGVELVRVDVAFIYFGSNKKASRRTIGSEFDSKTKLIDVIRYLLLRTNFCPEINSHARLFILRSGSLSNCTSACKNTETTELAYNEYRNLRVIDISREDDVRLVMDSTMTFAH